MKKINQIIFIFLLFIFLNSCGVVQESFSSNSKKTGSDAFLVEKKAPLVMPPNYEELPYPKTDQSDNQDNEKVKNLIIKTKENKELQNETDQNNESFQKSIIEKIKNN